MEYDYTKSSSGEYEIFESDPGGVTILDDDKSVLSLDPQLGEDLHPRNQGIHKRHKFAIGAGRREGFDQPRENFNGGRTGYNIPSKYRVNSIREGRDGLTLSDYDPRPPHYNPNSPNDTAHLYIDPRMRGTPTREGFESQSTDFGILNNLSIDILKVVMLFILIVVIAVWISFTVGYKIGKQKSKKLSEGSNK
jgi:hypothetical protein